MKINTKVIVSGSILIVLILTILGYFISFDDSTSFNYLWKGEEISISKLDLITNPILLTLFTVLFSCTNVLFSSWYSIRLNINGTYNKTRSIIIADPDLIQNALIYSIFFCPWLMLLLKPAYFYGGEHAYVLYFLIIAIQGVLFSIIGKNVHAYILSISRKVNNAINYFN